MVAVTHRKEYYLEMASSKYEWERESALACMALTMRVRISFVTRMRFEADVVSFDTRTRKNLIAWKDGSIPNTDQGFFSISRRKTPDQKRINNKSKRVRMDN